MSYRAVCENVYQFGPAAGSSPGIQLEMIVKVPGLSGLRNAYRSVLSAVGSSEISGASRWLEALLELGASLPAKRTSNVTPAAARRSNATLRIGAAPFSDGRSGSVDWPSYAADSRDPMDRFDRAVSKLGRPWCYGLPLPGGSTPSPSGLPT